MVTEHAGSRRSALRRGFAIVNSADIARLRQLRDTASLPQHFGIGLENGESELGWMIDSGVPWDFRYQYINQGWRDWNSPDGQFASIYAADSLSHGIIPVYIWYEIGTAGGVTRMVRRSKAPAI